MLTMITMMTMVMGCYGADDVNGDDDDGGDDEADNNASDDDGKGIDKTQWQPRRHQ